MAEQLMPLAAECLLTRRTMGITTASAMEGLYENLPTTVAPLSSLLDALRGLIQQGRHQALRAVDVVQVQTCWEIGCEIVEFEQGGEARADYGKSCCTGWQRP